MEKQPNTIKFNYLLPLGSVILLKGGKHKLMITGHNVSYEINPNGKNQYFDVDGRKPLIFNYMGVIWPEGDVALDRVALFNDDDIGKVYFKGFIEEEPEDINEKIDNKIKEINNK